MNFTYTSLGQAPVGGGRRSASLLRTRFQSHMHPHHLDRKPQKARVGGRPRRGGELGFQKVRSVASKTAGEGMAGVSAMQAAQTTVAPGNGVGGQVRLAQPYNPILRAAVSQGGFWNRCELIETKDYRSERRPSAERTATATMEQPKAEAAEAVGAEQTLQRVESPKIVKKKDRPREKPREWQRDSRPKLLQRGSQTSENTSRASRDSQKDEMVDRVAEPAKKQFQTAELAKKEGQDEGLRAYNGLEHFWPQQEQANSRKRLAAPAAMSGPLSFGAVRRHNEVAIL